MTIPAMMINEFKVPAMADGLRNGPADLVGYQVKYCKADMDDLTETSALQEIETRGLNPNGNVVLLNRDKFTFMDKYFIVLQYMERAPQ